MVNININLVNINYIDIYEYINIYSYVMLYMLYIYMLYNGEFIYGNIYIW